MDKIKKYRKSDVIGLVLKMFAAVFVFLVSIYFSKHLTENKYVQYEQILKTGALLFTLLGSFLVPQIYTHNVSLYRSKWIFKKNQLLLIIFCIYISLLLLPENISIILSVLIYPLSKISYNYGVANRRGSQSVLMDEILPLIFGILSFLIFKTFSSIFSAIFVVKLYFILEINPSKIISLLKLNGTGKNVSVWLHSFALFLFMSFPLLFPELFFTKADLRQEIVTYKILFLPTLILLGSNFICNPRQGRLIANNNLLSSKILWFKSVGLLFPMSILYFLILFTVHDTIEFRQFFGVMHLDRFTFYLAFVSLISTASSNINHIHILLFSRRFNMLSIILNLVGVLLMCLCHDAISIFLFIVSIDVGSKVLRYWIS